MKGEVRLGRKEAALQRTAREKQTYDRQKKSSRGRSVTIRDFDFLFPDHGLPSVAELGTVIGALIDVYRDGGIASSDHDRRIFSPDLDDLARLPIGVLDHKELPLPREFLPASRDALLAFCERMIIRNRDPEVVAFVVAGWPGASVNRSAISRADPVATAAARRVLDHHVTTLWSLSGAHSKLYEAIICGHHRTALAMLRSGPPAPHSTAAVRLVIARQGLLWCTNDVQMILARSHIGAKNPFGALVDSDQVQIKPERIVNDLKGHLRLMRLALALYATIEEEHSGKASALIPDDPLAESLARRIERVARFKGIDLASLRDRLDEVVAHLRKEGTWGDESFWQELVRPVSPNDIEQHFSGIWFSGLSGVQAAAVAILRYLQTEVAIERLIEEHHGNALPAFEMTALGDGAPDNAKNLLYLYRRELLRDKDFAKVRRSLAYRSKNAGWSATLAAEKFLRAAGQRTIGDDNGGPSSPGRTFYLLDVLPEVRLAR